MSFATGPRRIATFWPDTAAARAVGVVLAAITAAVLLAFVAVFGVNRVTPIPAWKEFVDIGAEGNLPTWWNATLLALVGAGAAIAAVFVEPRLSNPLTRSWIVVAVAGTYLSIDEAAGLHERFGRLVDRGSIDPPTYAWILPGALLAVAGAAVLVTVGRHLPSSTTTASSATGARSHSSSASSRLRSSAPTGREAEQCAGVVERCRKIDFDQDVIGRS